MKDKSKLSFLNVKLIIIIILMIPIIPIVSSITLKFFNNSSRAAIAMDVSQTLNLIGENNPANQAFNEEVKKNEYEKARKEEEKRILEQKRIEEEKRAAEEKRIAEEKARAEEEAHRLEMEKIENQKVAYLTFDDGPSVKVTPLILDILEKYDIKATFFVLGKMAAVNQDILLRIHQEGHSIGHHSYSHNYGYIYKNTDNFLKEIKITEEIFKEVLGEDFYTNLLRLPGGSFEQYKQKFVKVAGEVGYINYDWHALNGDAEGKGLTKTRLVNRLKSTVKGRKEVIILMHDTDTKMATVESLPEIIEHLISQGYIFKPLGEETVKEVIINE